MKTWFLLPEVPPGRARWLVEELLARGGNWARKSRFLSRLSGKAHFVVGQHKVLEASLSRNIESASGREDYIRVRLIKKGAEWVAEPLFGKSGLISTLVEADGLVRVDRNVEGLYQGDVVRVALF